MYWWAKASEKIEQKQSLARSLKNLFEEEKQTEDKLTEGTAEEKRENIVSLLKYKPGFLGANEHGVQQWMRHDEQEAAEKSQ